MATEQRIERLERTNRRYRWGITLVIFAAMIVGAAAAGDDVPDVIRARKVEGVNEAGMPVASLGSLFGNGMVRTSSPKGKTLVVLGLGRIGAEVAKRAKAFDMEVIAYDPYAPDEVFATDGVERAETLAPLLEKSDFISIHVLLTEETHHLSAPKSSRR